MLVPRHKMLWFCVTCYCIPPDPRLSISTTLETMYVVYTLRENVELEREGGSDVLLYRSQKCTGRGGSVGCSLLRLENWAVGVLPGEALLPQRWRKMMTWGCPVLLGFHSQGRRCREKLGSFCPQ